MNLKTDFSYFLLLLWHPSSSFCESSDSSALPPVLTSLLVSGLLPVLVDTPALFPVLMGRWLVSLNSLENISIFAL